MWEVVCAGGACAACNKKNTKKNKRRTLLVPDLQRLAADAVEDGHEARLVAVIEHGGCTGCFAAVEGVCGGLRGAAVRCGVEAAAEKDTPAGHLPAA